MTDFKAFERNLICASDSSRSGKYTVFTYEDTPTVTAYHEDNKKEYYLSVEEFKKLYTKA